MANTFARVYFPAFGDDSQLVDLLKLMCAHKDLTPERVDECEPIRRPFDVANVQDIASKLFLAPSFLWKSRGGIARGSVYLREGRRRKTSSLSMWINLERLEDFTGLMQVMCEAAGKFGSHYGYLHYLSEPEIVKGRQSGAIIGLPPKAPYLLNVTRPKLIYCLPDLYWGNIFGPEYVALFGGRERVATAPAYVVWEVAPETFYLQVSENILDLGARHRAFDAMREQVKVHLGRDCFFDNEAGIHSNYRAPALGW